MKRSTIVTYLMTLGILLTLSWSAAKAMGGGAKSLKAPQSCAETVRVNRLYTPWIWTNGIPLTTSLLQAYVNTAIKTSTRAFNRASSLYGGQLTTPLASLKPWTIPDETFNEIELKFYGKNSIAPNFKLPFSIDSHPVKGHMLSSEDQGVLEFTDSSGNTPEPIKIYIFHQYSGIHEPLFHGVGRAGIGYLEIRQLKIKKPQDDRAQYVHYYKKKLHDQVNNYMNFLISGIEVKPFLGSYNIGDNVYAMWGAIVGSTLAELKQMAKNREISPQNLIQAKNELADIMKQAKDMIYSEAYRKSCKEMNFHCIENLSESDFLYVNNKWFLNHY